MYRLSVEIDLLEFVLTAIAGRVIDEAGAVILPTDNPAVSAGLPIDPDRYYSREDLIGMGIAGETRLYHAEHNKRNKLKRIKPGKVVLYLGRHVREWLNAQAI